MTMRSISLASYKGGNMSSEKQEMYRKKVHENLCQSFTIVKPNGELSVLNEQYVTDDLCRNDIIGKEITAAEACIVSCLVAATGSTTQNAFSSLVRLATVHYKYSLNNHHKQSLVKNRVDRNLFERVVKSLSTRNTFFVAYMTTDDIVKQYNSVYKVVNFAPWQVRNCVTQLLNQDIDNIHLHSANWLDKSVLHMSVNTGKSYDLCKSAILESGVEPMDILRYSRFVAGIRGHRRKIQQAIKSASIGTETLRERFNKALIEIASVAPRGWENHLQGMALAISRKKYPAGSLVAIELEFGCEDGSKLQNLDADDYLDMPFVTWKGDGSVGSANGDGMCVGVYQEVNIMFNPSDQSGWETVKSVCDFLRSHGAMVNSTCGMHVHMDTRNMPDRAYQLHTGKLRAAYRAWAKYAVSNSRAYGHFCNVEAHARGRYSAVNTCCRTEHNTVEIRIGHGTLNYNKIKAWVSFNLWMKTASRRHLQSFETFMRSDCPAEIKAFVMGRMFRFADSWSSNGDNTSKQIKDMVWSTSDAWTL